MELEELTLINVFATGKTTPYIKSGTEIILVQDGKVSVGRINYNLDEFYSLEIERPQNEEELLEQAKKIVLQKKPSVLLSEVSQILICPLAVKEQMKWE